MEEHSHGRREVIGSIPIDGSISSLVTHDADTALYTVSFGFDSRRQLQRCGVSSSIGRAPGCGPGGNGIEARLIPQVLQLGL